eukprot:Blabericola_migrator_1__5173@NODE_2669_length_2479_cov_55_546849_g1547_i1_p1_GENE_NODE_2669_length_2479_cov_55_546849_g1547_i1NODE_2669_length_2479_cov_55_546849_g1547_i1_p1_ORF_typecomplete_len382_score61_342OGFeII_Oxy_3/PF13640_6/1_1e042OGFeII_Oxy_3/PF13640_6/0_0013_NODE_2669_length_2479_cov_55_546849_g1547_i110732218
MGVVWPDETKELFWLACRSVFDLRTSKLIEQKLRKGSGTEGLTEVESCQCDKSEECHGVEDSLSPYCFKKTADDTIGDQLRMLTSKRIFIRDYMADVAERATRAFKTIMSATEGNIPKRRKAETQRICLSNSIEKILVEAVLLERTRSRRLTAKDGGQVAFPSSYRAMFAESPFVALDSISRDCMAAIMNSNVCEIDDWVPDTGLADTLRQNYEWIEMNNVMEDQTPFSPNPNRTDHALWLSLGDLPNRDALPGVSYLLQKLTSLPFEFNSKTSLKLILSNDALFGLFAPGTYWRRHKDNTSISDFDNGRKITVLYFLNPSEQEGADYCDLEVSVQTSKEALKKRPKPNSVWIFETRDTEVDIQCGDNKTYVVYYWLYGML